jgi:GNAT superfamily N-acetyltransferase
VAEVRAFEARHATPDDWRRYHAFRRRRHAEERPDEPLRPNGVVETLLARDSPQMTETSHVVLDGDEMVAALTTERTRPESPDYPTNRHLMWMDVWVLNAHRHRGIARDLLPVVLAEMDEHGTTVLSAVAAVERGQAFIGHLGAQARYVERESRLALDEVDWDLVERWVRQGAAASPGMNEDRRGRAARSCAWAPRRRRGSVDPG